MDGVVLTTLNLISTEDHRTRADTMIMSEGKKGQHRTDLMGFWFVDSSGGIVPSRELDLAKSTPQWFGDPSCESRQEASEWFELAPS